MRADFVSCDWGTSNLRLRWVESTYRSQNTLSIDPSAAPSISRPRVVREIRSQGDGALSLRNRAVASGRPAAELFEETLLRHLEAGEGADESSPLPVYVSGMASSSIGWREVAYAKLPFPLDGSGLEIVRAPTSRSVSRHIYLVGGLSTTTDVLRGEETETLGLLSMRGLEKFRRASVVLLPGTHSKHLVVEGGVVRTFRTFVTGELFDVLSQHSILRHSVAPFDAARLSALEEEAFDLGVHDGSREPLTSALFRVRTRQVIDDSPPSATGAYLSGLLLGAEVAPYLRESGERSILIGGDRQLSPLYARAFRTVSIDATVASTDRAETAIAAGHDVLHRRLHPSESHSDS